MSMSIVNLSDLIRNEIIKYILELKSQNVEFEKGLDELNERLKKLEGLEGLEGDDKGEDKEDEEDEEEPIAKHQCHECKENKGEYWICQDCDLMLCQECWDKEYIKGGHVIKWMMTISGSNPRWCSNCSNKSKNDEKD